MTSVKLSNVSFQLKKKANGFDHWFSELHLFLHTEDGNHVEVADMKIHCMQGDQVGARVNMHRHEDIKWVVGQIAPGKHSADAHFIPDPWAEPCYLKSVFLINDYATSCPQWVFFFGVSVEKAGSQWLLGSP